MSALTWSPDGRFIAYASNTEGNAEIYVMNVGNRKTRRLTDHLSTDTSPTWSPDGKWIVFISNRMGNNDIYKVAVTARKIGTVDPSRRQQKPCLVTRQSMDCLRFLSERKRGSLYNDCQWEIG